ncbi:unnamed protein product [Protopolystoma xenopodis]|uniref:Uncharacterized protein n=1 Tax=Protopolystoma xenopodis TaxID=117903 RepID=A0A3S5FE61_9PLAT|nr:unnamed protein product [Protopolystoma xenopodis]
MEVQSIEWLRCARPQICLSLGPRSALLATARLRSGLTPAHARRTHAHERVCMCTRSPVQVYAHSHTAATSSAPERGRRRTHLCQAYTHACTHAHMHAGRQAGGQARTHPRTWALISRTDSDGGSAAGTQF